jgi:hypothetical protein
LERKMRETVARPTKSDSRKVRKIDELRDRLAIARENLVQAVSERSPESVLMPLRNKVGELLEKIEMLYAVKRLRR